MILKVEVHAEVPRVAVKQAPAVGPRLVEPQLIEPQLVEPQLVEPLVTAAFAPFAMPRLADAAGVTLDCCQVLWAAETQCRCRPSASA